MENKRTLKNIAISAPLYAWLVGKKHPGQSFSGVITEVLEIDAEIAKKRQA